MASLCLSAPELNWQGQPNGLHSLTAIPGSGMAGASCVDCTKNAS
jgi:hypothetical protein